MALQRTGPRSSLFDPPLVPSPPSLPPNKNRESRPADVAAIAALQAQVAELQHQVASYRAQLAVLEGAQPPSRAGSAGGRQRAQLPPLSSVGAGLPVFPPPGAAIVSARKA